MKLFCVIVKMKIENCSKMAYYPEFGRGQRKIFKRYYIWRLNGAFRFGKHYVSILLHLKSYNCIKIMPNLLFFLTLSHLFEDVVFVNMELYSFKFSKVSIIFSVSKVFFSLLQVEFGLICISTSFFLSPRCYL